MVRAGTHTATPRSRVIRTHRCSGHAAGINADVLDRPKFLETAPGRLPKKGTGLPGAILTSGVSWGERKEACRRGLGKNTAGQLFGVCHVLPGEQKTPQTVGAQ